MGTRILIDPAAAFQMPEGRIKAGPDSGEDNHGLVVMSR